MRKLLAFVFTVLVLAGCTSPEPLDGLHQIGFASQLSRAVVEGVSDLQNGGILLFASYTLDNQTASLLDNEHLYYDSSISSWKYDHTRYWVPGIFYRFCAVYPYNIQNCTYNNNGEVTIQGYTGNTNSADLLYTATTRDLQYSEDYSAVPLHFNHACAALDFRIVNASGNAITAIRNIYLTGLYNQGNFHFDIFGTAEWQITGNCITADNIYSDSSCTLPTNNTLPVNVNYKHPLFDTGVLLVVPQEIYKTDVKLCLEYSTDTSYYNKTYIDREILLGNIGSSAPTEWVAGQKYTYTLTITDDFITSDVVVVDWVDHYVDL